MADTPQKIRPFNHQKQPSSPESLRQWLDTELVNIQNTLNDVIAAIKQLQTFTGV
jgi:hypothetical protein